MAEPRTIKVTRIADGEPMVINETDFDGSKHALRSVVAEQAGDGGFVDESVAAPKGGKKGKGKKGKDAGGE